MKHKADLQKQDLQKKEALEWRPCEHTTTISQPPVSSVVVTYETRETADRELRDVVRGNIFDPNSPGELSYGNMALFIGSALFIIAMIAGRR